MCVFFLFFKNNVKCLICNRELQKKKSSKKDRLDDGEILSQYQNHGLT